MYNNLSKEELVKKIEELEKENNFLRQDFMNSMFSFFIDSIPIPIFYKNTKGEYVFCNKAFADFENLPKSRIIGSTAFDLFPYEKAEIYDKTDKELLINKGNTTFQKTVINNGIEKHLMVYRSYITNPELEESGIIGILIDITNKEIAERKLKEKEEFYRNITENMLDMISMSDVSGRFLYASPAHSIILGYDPEYLMDKNVFQFIHPDDLSSVRKIFEEKLKQKDSGKAEYRYQKAIGDYVWLESSAKALLNSEQEVESVIYVTREIEDRKKSQANLKFLSNSALVFLGMTLEDDIFDFIGKQLYRLNPNSLIVINQYLENENNLVIKNFQSNKSSIEKILSFSGKHPKGMKFKLDLPQLDLYKGKLDKIKLKEFRNNINNTSSFLFDKVCQALDIEDFYYIGLTVENKLYGSIGIIPPKGETISDINTIETFIYQASISFYRQNIEKELLEAKEQAVLADKLKSAFLANMSHEIRTPMNAILGFSQLLCQKELPKDESNKFLNIIYNNSKQLLNIINDIIDLSKIESGQLEIINTKTNINILCDEIYSRFNNELKNISKKQITLSLVKGLRSDEANIIADEGRILQILTNLVGNATKFTHEGKIEYGYHLETGQKVLEFYVKDTGIGISKEHQKIIFDRFKQADDTSTRKYGGTGLGLTISKQLVEMMGGQIWLKSEPNVGSEFRFTIPFVADTEKIIVKREELETQDFNFENKKFLIVEDDHGSYLFLESILKTTGVELFWAENAQMAFEIIKNNSDLDLILMDVQLPEITGLEATKIIRKTHPNIPIIAQTANAMDGDREISIKAGCNDYISKPINYNELLNKISSLIN